MKLSYDATWQDSVRLLRAHWDMVAALAGVFILLPALAQTLYVTAPVITKWDAAAIDGLQAYFVENFPVLFGVRLATLIGAGALLTLFVGPRNLSVGDAILRAVRLLPSLLLADILVQIICAIGLIALIIPGLYLIARTVLSQAAMMAEGIANPLRAIGRSFDLTRGMGWQILGLILIVMIAAWITISAAMAVLGVVSELLLPEAATAMARALFSALSSTVLTVTFILLSAGIFRQTGSVLNGHGQ